MPVADAVRERDADVRVGVGVRVTLRLWVAVAEGEGVRDGGEHVALWVGVTAGDMDPEGDPEAVEVREGVSGTVGVGLWVRVCTGLNEVLPEGLRLRVGVPLTDTLEVAVGCAVRVEVFVGVWDAEGLQVMARLRLPVGVVVAVALRVDSDGESDAGAVRVGVGE